MVSHLPEGLIDEENDDPLLSIPRHRKPKSDTELTPSVRKGQRRNAGHDGSSASSSLSSKPKKKDRLQSFHDTILESMEETQRMRKAQDEGNASVLIDTVQDIKVATSAAFASVKEWAKKANSDQVVRSSRSYELDERKSTMMTDQTGGSNENPGQAPRQACGTPHSEPGAAFASKPQTAVQRNTIIQDLAWPFMACGLEVSESLPRKNDIGPHIMKMKEVVAKAVNGEIGPANEIWKFAATSKDDDDHTTGTWDTVQEENNQLRRLGSWGTVGTSGTANTYNTFDTGFTSTENSAPTEIKVALEDDEGNPIDPLLLEKAQKSRGRRKQRREKVVKFDYPPIKSLRQCPRHDPADLPDLFFTEHELDQIEDDRFSTMSTDDIEIVAVSDKAEQEPEPNPKSPKGKRGASFADSSVEARHSPSSSTAREQPEAGRKQGKGRPTTPYRKRRNDDEADFSASEHGKSPSSSGRLVKGVQIYLRERSTGA